MTDSALVTVVKHLGITRDDVIIPVRGEPWVCPTSGTTHVWFKRPGVEGEFHAQIKVEHSKPFGSKQHG